LAQRRHPARAHRAAAQLEAIVHLHTSKEGRAYLPPIARHLSLAEQERLLDELHATVAVDGSDGTSEQTPARPVHPYLSCHASSYPRARRLARCW
jgi:hypothetical protein